MSHAIEPSTTDEYLQIFPIERGQFIRYLRKQVSENLTAGFEVSMSYAVKGCFVGHSFYPLGYHCGLNLLLPSAIIGSQ